MRLALVVALAGCNAILDNENFTGPTSDAAPDSPCLSCAQVDCASMGLPSTRVMGTVFAPNGTLPLYNALVYVPQTALDPIPEGVSGPQCASGSPLLTTRTGTLGEFTLEDMPAGTNVPLVIQVGKWRRKVTVSVAACTDNMLDASTTRLPRTAAEGHIPKIAITTGGADTLECIARDLGIETIEIGTGGGSERIQLFMGTGTITSMQGAGALAPAQTLFEPSTLAQYDNVLVGCEGTTTTATAARAQALYDWTNMGGRVWLTHFESAYLQMGPSPWPTLATFSPPPSTNLTDGTPIMVDQTSSQGQAFASWLLATGASTTPGVIATRNSTGRSSCTASNPALTRRVTYLDPSVSGGLSGVHAFTWSAANGGRMTFSDMHANIGANGTTYPVECRPPLPQQNAIAFDLFDAPTCGD